MPARVLKFHIKISHEKIADMFFVFFSSPEHEVLMVSYCGQSMSVVRRPSCVVRRAACGVRRQQLL